MSSAGTVLRSAREDQNRTLAEIADELCITQRYLRAIEEDDLTILPGMFFYKSFVRQYAALLGVDSKRIQAAVEAMAPAEPPPPPRATAPPAETLRPRVMESFDRLRRLPPHVEEAALRDRDPLVQDFNKYFSDSRVGMSVAGLAVALLACSGFYAWWTRTPSAPVASAPASIATVPVAPANAEHANTSVTVPTEQDSQGVNYAVLDLAATEATWVSIVSEGKVVFSGIIEPSQTKSISGIQGAQMKVGNAGGIEVRWKGKPIGPIGPRGQVRTVVLKQDDVEILQPPAPVAPSEL